MRLAGLGVALAAIFPLAACKPPASDVIRGDGPAEAAHGASAAQLGLPDTSGAFWATSGTGMRIIYGQPGKPPLVALACLQSDGETLVELTRYAPADPRAAALAALTGNGHIARLPVDAIWNGRAWLWRGTWPAQAAELDVLTGPHAIELTIPGAGTVVLNPGARPAQLVDHCRQQARVLAQARLRE